MGRFDNELLLTQRHIDDALGRIRRQREMIRDLRAAGNDTKAAEQLLKGMLSTLESFEAHQRTLEDERFRAP